MPVYPRTLIYVLFCTLAGLVLGCALAAVGLAGYQCVVSLAAGTAPPSGLISAVLLVAAFGVIYGVAPAMVYGAPAYAWLAHRRHANTLTAAGVGLAPGLVLLAIRHDRAPLYLGFGFCVALATHFVAQWPPVSRRMGPNNPSKPTPLRGSA